MKITFLGHASLQIQTAGRNIIIDPYISANEHAAHIDITKLEADYILLTHAHGDHILDVDAIASRTGALIVSNPEVAGHFAAKGFQSHGMNFGGSWKLDFGVVRYVHATHSSSFPDGSYGGNPGGFIIMSENKTVYIAGDTGLMMDMKLIPMRHQLDLAVFPIGSNYTMDVEEAVIASDFVGCNRVLGYHYDTFGYIKINQDEAKRKFSEAGKELILLPIGDSIDV